MASEERDGSALALSMLTVRGEVQEGPRIFSCCFVKCTKNIAKGSVGAMDKDGRVVLNRPNSIYTQ
ncbi:hypothetical protein BGY98DRAFT_985890 [Russula aff. rugulosa BPL654]|nr:hypothetical protein BGY98DRAFT_985890 [Russula aff. rugulosa BPL654]